MLFCWTMVSFVGTASGESAQTDWHASLATATQVEVPSILERKQPGRVFFSEVGVTRFDWPYSAFARESSLKPNWLLNVIDNLYPRKGSRVAFDCLIGHHEWSDFNSEICVCAWIFATKNLRRRMTSSLPILSCDALSVLICRNKWKKLVGFLSQKTNVLPNKWLFDDEISSIQHL